MAVKFLNGIDVDGSMNIAASDVPNLDASKITSGTFSADRIPTGLYQPAGDYLDLETANTTFQPIGNYLTSVPSEYLTQTEGDARYLQSLPSHSHDTLTSTWQSINLDTLTKGDFNLGFEHFSSSSSGTKPPINDNANAVLHVGTHSGGYWHQLAFSSTEDMYYRATQSNSIGSWRKVWDSGNLTNVSQLTNDSGYLTSLPSHNHDTLYDAIGSADAVSQQVNQRIDTEVFDAIGNVAGSIPTNNNQLTNGAGYITSFDITTQTDSKYLRSNANDTATGLIVFNGGIQVLSGTGGGQFRLKRNSGSNTGDDVFDMHMDDGNIFFDIDNDLDGDSSGFVFRYGTGGSFSNLLTFSSSDIAFKGNSLATQSYVNTAVSNLVASAPATLDTLNELAAALGDDANFSTTVANNIGAIDTRINNEVIPYIDSVAGDAAKGVTAYGWGNHASAGYLTTETYTGTITGVSTGTGLDGTASSGAVTITLDLSELTDMTASVDTAVDELILLDNGAERRKRFAEIFGSAAYQNTSAFDSAGSSAAVSTALNERIDTEVFGAIGDVAGTIPTNNNQLTNGAGYITSADGGNADTVDGYQASQLWRITGATNATVGGGWVTVAHAGQGGRWSGEVIVTDGESGDHSFIRIHWMRSYQDSNFTVLNCGGHANRITGARVLYQTSDSTYGWKYLQVYVTTSSNYYVRITQEGDTPNFSTITAVTPVVENTKSGYAVHGSELTGLENASLAAEEGIKVGGTVYTNSHGDSSQWNTAYGWGDHSAAGYLTSLPSHNHDTLYDSLGSANAVATALNERIDTEVFDAIATVDGNIPTNNNQLTNGAGYITAVPSSFTTTNITATGYIKGGGQQLVLSAGEAQNYATGQTAEYIYMNAEQGIEINSDTGNWAGGWAARKTAYLRGDQLTLDGETLTKTNIQNFKTAYGWGNHASAGYLTSIPSTYATDAEVGTAVGVVDARINDEVIPYIDVVAADASKGAVAHGWGDHSAAGYLTSLPAHNHDGSYDPIGSADAVALQVNTRIDQEVIPSIPTNNNQLLNGAGYITAVPSSFSTNSITIGNGVTLSESTDRADLLMIKSSTSTWGGLQISNTSNEIIFSMMGDGNVIGLYDDLNNDWVIQRDENGSMRFYANASNTVTVTTSGLSVTGAITASGDVTAFSDARVKENVETLSNALESVKQMRGVTYNKIGEEKQSVGVIAQELEEVVPQLVHTDEEGMKSVAYGNITAVLIEALKEQQAQIEELKARLDGLTK